MPFGIGRADGFGSGLVARPPGSLPHSCNDLPRDQEAQQHREYQKKFRHRPELYGAAFEPSEN